MTQWMWHVYSMTLALGTLVTVGATDGPENQPQQSKFQLQSEIDEFLHNQIIQAGLSSKGLAISVEGPETKSLIEGGVEPNFDFDIPYNWNFKSHETGLRSTLTALEAKNRRRRAKHCKTPSGKLGYCLDLGDCPELILDLDVLARSVCWRGLFNPGVCCPARVNDPVTPGISTHKPITSSSTTTTQRPAITVRTTPRPANTNKPYACGQRVVRSGRIINGTESYPGKWPWAAALFLHGNRNAELWCGGSLISKRYVLTAAHCTREGGGGGKPFSPLQFTVHLGDNNIKSSHDDHNSQIRGVHSIKRHPDFHAPTYYNDVALLKLDREVVFTDYIIPACLPADDLAGAPLDYLQGYMPTVVGWGRTIDDTPSESPILRETRVPVWKNEACANVYSKAVTIDEKYLCAGFIEGGTDACLGDSGGPLVLYTVNEWTQIGITSFGKGCAKPNEPGVYTRLTQFLPWIKLNAEMV